MKICSISVSNYRSIDLKGITLDFSPSYSVIVGENNVGKSTIPHVIRFVLQSQMPENEDYFKGNEDHQIYCGIHIELCDRTIKEIIRIIGFPFNNERYAEAFATRFLYEYILNPEGMQLTQRFILGDLIITRRNNQSFCSILGIETSDTLSGNSSWGDVIEEMRGDPENNPKKIIRNYIENHNNYPILFPTDFGLDLLTMLQDNIKFIDEYRERPRGQGSETLHDPTGKDLATQLYNRKTGSREKRKLFIKTQGEFESYFSNGSLDAMNLQDHRLIVIEKGDFESTTPYIGAGVIGTTHVLADMVSNRGKVIIIDSPELHLHPSIQRKMNEKFQQNQDIQIIAITHSPYFVELGKGNKIFRFAHENNHLVHYENDLKNFTEKDLGNIETLINLDSRDIFFCRMVFLTEGATEFGALPMLFKQLDFDLYKHSISLISVGGTGNLKLYSKLCRAYSIPFFILTDNDGRRQINKIEKEIKPLHHHILEGKFEDMFPEDLIEKVKKEMGPINYEKKPMRGRHIAEKIISDGLEVPDGINMIKTVVEDYYDNL